MSDPVFVERNGGKINGIYANTQPGYAEEQLPDDHAEVIAFRNPPPTAGVIREQVFLVDVDRLDLVTRLKTATPAQIKSYVTSNVTDLASARVMLMKILMVLSANVQK